MLSKGLLPGVTAFYSRVPGSNPDRSFGFSVHVSKNDTGVDEEIRLCILYRSHSVYCSKFEWLVMQLFSM